MEEKSHISNLIDHLKEYFTTRLNLLLLKSSQKTFKVLSSIISNTILIIFFIFFLLFVSIGMALLIGEYYHHLYIGFMAVAGGYLVIGLLVYLNRKKWLEENITNIFIKKFFMEDNHHE